MPTAAGGARGGGVGRVRARAGRSTVVVFGGSQGALHVDQTVAGALAGPRATEPTSSCSCSTGARAGRRRGAGGRTADGAASCARSRSSTGWSSRYAVADLAVARAGATSIAELTVCGIPSILVPYPHATEDHQEANARELERAGAAEVVPGRRPSPDGLARRILDARGRRRPQGRDGGSGPRRGRRPTRTSGSPTLVDGGARDDGRTSAPAGSIPTLAVPSLDGVRSVHLIGVGGAGMRNLARLFLARGIAVTGSDLKDSKGLVELRGPRRRRLGGSRPGEARHARRGRDLERDRPPRTRSCAAARERGLPVWARQQALAAFAAGHRAIAVAGTHGKTTTTSMIAVILEQRGARSRTT